jgi:tRNA-specific 2-thiouridylase
MDRTKDQSYYLSAIRESGLRKALFPLQNIPKTEVRELAKKYALPTAERPESMGLCFVGERRRFNDFLGELLSHYDGCTHDALTDLKGQYIPPKAGTVVDLDSGKVVGKHEGLWRYTIGAGAKVPGMPQRTFVAKKDLQSNTLFIVSAA